jgi:hypothetical protein
VRGISIVQQSSNSTEQPGIGIASSQDLAWVVLMILVTLSAVVAQVYAYIPKLRRRNSASMSQRQKTICYGCKYFNNNLYLKCAIDPSIVLTEQSIDCKDYSPQHER